MQVEPPNIGPGACDLARTRWVLGFDTEATLTPVAKRKRREIWRAKHGHAVCSSWSGTDEVPPPILAAQARGEAVVRQGSRVWGALVDRDATREVLRWALDPAQDVVFVGQVLRYDWLTVARMFRWEQGIVESIFRLYAEGRVVDVFLRDKLIAIAQGWFDHDPLTGREPGFSLADVVRRRFGVTLDKGSDTWRTRYSELMDLPLERWPQEAVDYPMADAEWALLCALDQAPIGSPVLSAQLEPITTAEGGVIDEQRQARADWSLYLQSTWAMRTNPEKVEAWATLIEEHLSEAEEGLRRVGILRPNGKKNAGLMRELVASDPVWEGNPPRTDPSTRFPDGQVKTDADTLAQCTLPELRAWAEAAVYEKYRSTYLESARLGTDGPMPYNFNPIVESGRTSSYSDNIQNPPKKGDYRGCVEARPGKLLCSVDYSGAELVGLGQIHYWVFGHSALRDVINAGIDPHAPVAAQLAGVDLDTMVGWLNTPTDANYKAAKNVYRQGAKAANFGLPGGLSAPTLVDYAAGMGVDLYQIAVSVDPYKASDDPAVRADVALGYAREVVAAWRAAVPEGPEMMKMVQAELQHTYKLTITQFVSGRQRGGCGYTDACNTFFQGLIADCAKEACWRVAVACYLHPDAAVALLKDAYWDEVTDLRAVCEAAHGVRPVAFIHDEILFEGDEATAHVWAPAVGALMRDAMRMYIRDVAVEAKPALMRNWSKDVRDVYDDQGRLVCWYP